MNIPLAKPDITQKEINEVIKVLKSGRLALGAYTEKFESAVADYIGVKHAVAVSSGTAGLHILMKIFDIKDGDEVITTPFSFIASANCILFERAKPIFVDIDPLTLCIDPKEVEKKINKKTKAIIAVDVFGHPCDWTALTKIAQKYRLTLIDDSCEALGSTWRGKKCGSFGSAGIFAFYPNKQITSGEGGMLLTNNKKTANLARALRNQGRLNYTWLNHDVLGYNYRMDEMSAALGYVQITRLPKILSKRSKVASLYTQKLNRLNIELPFKHRDAHVEWFVYVIKLKSNFGAKKRDEIMKKLKARGIACSNYFPPIHLQPVYRKLGYKKGDFTITESVSDRTIALPFHTDLSRKKINFVAKLLHSLI